MLDDDGEIRGRRTHLREVPDFHRPRVEEDAGDREPEHGDHIPCHSAKPPFSTRTPPIMRSFRMRAATWWLASQLPPSQ